MLLLVDEVAHRLRYDEHVEHSLQINQRRKFGARLKTARTEVPHSAGNSPLCHDGSQPAFRQGARFGETV